MLYQKVLLIGLVIVLLAGCAPATPAATPQPSPSAMTAAETVPTKPIIEIGSYTCSMLGVVNLSRHSSEQLSTVLELLQVFLILDEDLTVMAYDATQYELLIKVGDVEHPIQEWLDGKYDSRAALNQSDIVIYHDNTPICWGLFPIPTE